MNALGFILIVTYIFSASYMVQSNVAQAAHCVGGQKCGRTYPNSPPSHGNSYECDWLDGAHHTCRLVKSESVENQCTVSGCVIGIQNQTLGEIIPIADTPFSLHYQSERVPGRKGSIFPVSHGKHFGGWVLNIHHVYDRPNNILFLGSGSQQGPFDYQSIVENIDKGFLVGSEDGLEVYVFDNNGRHDKTVSVLTGKDLYRFRYDQNGYLERIYDHTDRSTKITRVKRVINIVSPNGFNSKLTLDTIGFLAKISDPKGKITKLINSSTGLVTSITNQLGHSSSYTNDPSGLLIKEQDADGTIRKLARVDQSDGYSVEYSSPLDKKTTVSVQLLPDAIKQTIGFPNGLQGINTKNFDGMTSFTSPVGTKIQLSLAPDPRFKMHSPIIEKYQIVTPSGLTSTLNGSRIVQLRDNSDPLSLLKQSDIYKLNGQTFDLSLDALTNTASFVTPEGRRARMQFEQSQGKLSTLNLYGAEFHFTYNGKGDLKKVQQGFGADARELNFNWSYSPNRTTLSMTNPLGQKSKLNFDSAGMLDSHVSPDGSMVRYRYDATRNLANVIQPNAPLSGSISHAFTYTKVGLLSTYAGPLATSSSSLMRYRYNDDRQIVGIEKPSGETITFDYDSVGRLVAIDEAHNHRHFTYDIPTGNLKSALSNGIETTYEYDGMLLLTSNYAGNISGSIAKSYNHNLQVSSLTISGGDLTQYEYDADGFVVKAGPLTLIRDTNTGRLAGAKIGQVEDSITYNAFREPILYTVSYAGQEVFRVEYERDKLGRITRKVEIIGDKTQVFEYVYDVAGRLVKAFKGKVSNFLAPTFYQYDKNGNRVSVKAAAIVPAMVKKAQYDSADQISVYGDISFSHNSSGDMVEKKLLSGSAKYTYNAMGSLTAALLPDGNRYSYSLDGYDRRVVKAINGVSTKKYLYDANRIVAELDSGNMIVSKFFYATRSHVPDYLIRGGDTYRIITDQVGSPRLIMNVDSGQIIQQLEYDEFGRLILDTNPGFQPFGFAGGLYDSDTQLVHFGRREYDPELGRWTTLDPLLFAAGDTNLYAYVGNDPVNYIDASGLKPAKASSNDPHGFGDFQSSEVWKVFETLKFFGVNVLAQVGAVIAEYCISPVREVNKFTGGAFLANTDLGWKGDMPPLLANSPFGPDVWRYGKPIPWRVQEAFTILYRHTWMDH